MALNKHEDLAIAVIDARFAYCGQEHPLMSLLYKKALSSLLRDGINAKSGGGASLDVSSLSEVPGESSLNEINPMELLNKDGQLPPLPTVLNELQRVIQDESSDIEAVATVVRSDTGLSAFLLRLVNSAFYSFPTRIDTITRAVSIVGIRPLYTLATGMLFQDMVNAVPKGTMSTENFWRHSIAVGLAAQELWREMGYKEDERLFTAGLLHDIGKLALACLLPKETDFHQQLLVRSRIKPPCEVEKELLGFDHSRFGGMLLRKWNMPSSLIHPVLRHHQPQAAAHGKEIVVIHLADVMINAMGITTVPGSVVPKLDVGAWEMLGLNLNKMDEFMDLVIVRLHDVCQSFDVQPEK